MRARRHPPSRLHRFVIGAAVAGVSVMSDVHAASASFAFGLPVGPQALSSASVPAPTGLTSGGLSCQSSPQSSAISLSWTGSDAVDGDGTYLVQHYSVLRSSNNGPYSQVGATSGVPPATSFTDDTASAALPPTTYYAISGDQLLSEYGTSGGWAQIGTYSFSTEQNLLAVTPDGTKLYAAESGPAGGAVLVVGSLYGDANYDKVVSTITLPGPNPDPVAVDIAPNGSAAYILDANNDQIDVVSSPSSSYKVSAEIPVGSVSDPAAIAVTPSSSQLLVANYFSSTLSIISTATGTVTYNVALSQPLTGSAPAPMGIAVLPSGNDAYVVDQANNVVDEIALTGASSGTVVATIPVGSQANIDTPADIDVATTALGPLVFVGDHGDKTIDVISGSVVVKQVAISNGGERPVAIVAAPNGCYVAAVASFSGRSTVYLINPANYQTTAEPSSPEQATCAAIDGGSDAWLDNYGAIVATPTELSYKLQASTMLSGGGFASGLSVPLQVTLAAK